MGKNYVVSITIYCKSKVYFLNVVIFISSDYFDTAYSRASSPKSVSGEAFNIDPGSACIVKNENISYNHL